MRGPRRGSNHMDRDQVANLFLPLFAELNASDYLTQRRPLLAHYTSLEVLESIVSTNEIWFSNPLCMNDLEEVRFGIIHGANAAKQNEQLQAALSTNSRRALFNEEIDRLFQEFERDHVFDTYVFCFSEHDAPNGDGMLSMWRGYGGNGKGVAIIFDTSKIHISSERKPLVVSRVEYGTSEHRIAWLANLCRKSASIIAFNEIADEHLGVAANLIFERIKLFSLFSKHEGFKEEREWRVVYRREIDTDKAYDRFFGYALGRGGVEPKFKFKIEPIPGITADDLSLERILFAILLGPTSSSVLAQTSVRRMIELKGRPEIAKRVFASTIPLRPA